MAPQFQFVVLNRLSSENLVETIDDNFQTELTEQFLLYRNLQEEILGVWFYSPPERAAIAELLDTIHATGSAPADTGGAAVDVTEAVEPPAASSVANFFAMAGAAEGAAKPPPMPTSAVVSAEEEPTPPADAPVTSSVANFFSMAASAPNATAAPPSTATLSILLSIKNTKSNDATVKMIRKTLQHSYTHFIFFFERR